MDLGTKWRRTADQLIALIDDALNRQVNAILHHPEFQQMEALLARPCHAGARGKPQRRSQGQALERQLGSAGSQPGARRRFRPEPSVRDGLQPRIRHAGRRAFGLIVGDYMCAPEMPETGMRSARWFSSARSQPPPSAPSSPGASPQALGLERFDELDRVQDFSWLAHDPSRIRWNSLRAREIPAFSASSRRRPDATAA